MEKKQTETVVSNKEKDREAKERAFLRRQKAKAEKEEREARLLAEQQKKKEKEDAGFMREAIRQAKKAAKLQEVPIGCVLVKDGEIVARV